MCYHPKVLVLNKNTGPIDCRWKVGFLVNRSYCVEEDGENVLANGCCTRTSRLGSVGSRRHE